MIDERCECAHARHAIDMNERCHADEWVMSHIWMSHVTNVNKSCYTYEQVTHTNESCHTYEMSHIWISHATNTSPVAKGLLGRRALRVRETLCLPAALKYYICDMTYLCGMTPPYVWLIRMCDILIQYVWHTCDIRVTHVWHTCNTCDIRVTYMWHTCDIHVTCHTYGLLHTCDKSHEWVSFICATCLIQLSHLTYWYLLNESIVYVTWQLHMRDMTHSRVCHDSCLWATCLVHMCNRHIHILYTTYSYLPYDVFIFVIWFV